MDDERIAAAQRWLDVEVGRIWLLAEASLRRLQRAGLRPASDHSALVEIEAILAARRAARGAAGDDLERALDAIDRELPALRAAAPIGRVIAGCGLHVLEVEVLMIALAPHIDPPLAALFGLLRGASPGGVDLALVTELLRADRADRVALLDALAPECPLLAWRLVQVASAESPEAYASLLHRSIQPALDLVSALCGRDDQFAVLRADAVPACGADALAGLRLDDEFAAELARRFDAAVIARDQPDDAVPWLVLWGPRGAGKTELALRWAACLARPLLAVDLTPGAPQAPAQRSWQERLRRAQRDSLVHGAVLYVGPLPPEFLASHAAELAHELARYPAIAAFGVETTQAPRLGLARALQEVALPLPSAAVQLALWADHLPEAGGELDLAGLARAYHLTPGEIAEVAAEARALAGLRAPSAARDRRNTMSDLRAGIERRLRNQLGDVARRLEITSTWDDLVLAGDDARRLVEFVSRSRFAERVYVEWGFGPRIGYGKGLIALFSGPPGTGKTMLAGLVASELDLELYQVDLSQVMSKWVGETEKQLSRLFDLAQRAHAVLLFDEADALFAKRTELNSSHDRYGNLAVNYLLQRLEQYTGIAILTTNKEAALDPALQRRISVHLRLELPEVEEREQLWRSMLPRGAPCAPGIDFAELARSYELSGGYIKNAAVRAAFFAAAHGQPLTTEMMHHAAVLELEDMGRLASEVARRRANK